MRTTPCNDLITGLSPCHNSNLIAHDTWINNVGTWRHEYSCLFVHKFCSSKLQFCNHGVLDLIMEGILELRHRLAHLLGWSGDCVASDIYPVIENCWHLAQINNEKYLSFTHNDDFVPSKIYLESHFNSCVKIRTYRSLKINAVLCFNLLNISAEGFSFGVRLTSKHLITVDSGKIWRFLTCFKAFYLSLKNVGVRKGYGKGQTHEQVWTVEK